MPNITTKKNKIQHVARFSTSALYASITGKKKKFFPIFIGTMKEAKKLHKFKISAK